MSYQSLARKYRPRRFQDMVGQDAITKALSNAIRLNRIPQGVIFSGVRGVGKTTTARLYAKALNCTYGPTSEPCNECDSCLAINEGIHEDVLEIDGASNTSVDDIRALQETLEYVPQRSIYKVYIIDEVHMLSQSAFNALLKTLEEPPEHVVFSFATTELQKVPETILSRCQTFHLKRLSLATIVDRLREILECEGVEYENHALVAVAKEGRGSMRDSLTFLDQVIALGDGCVVEASLKGLINAASSRSYFELLEGLVSRNPNIIISVIQRWDEKGVPLDEAIEEVAKFCRHGFVLKELGIDAIDTNLLGLAPTELQYLQTISDGAPVLDLNRIFRTLVACRKDLDGSELDRCIVENYCLEWCLDPGLPSLEDLKKASFGSGKISVSGGGATSTADIGNDSQKSPSTNLKQRWNEAFGQVNGSSKSPAEFEDVGKNREFIKAEAVVKTKSVVSETTVPPSTELLSKQLSENYEGSNTESLRKAHGQKTAPAHAGVDEISSKSNKTPIYKNNECDIASKPKFPSSWRELVDVWKLKKPLQGRILEETVPVSYSQAEIRVRVDPTSMAGAKLLNPDHKKRVLEGIRELFSFEGQLTVDELSKNSSELESCSDSLLSARQKKEEQERLDLFEEIKSHPITKEALDVFDGTINAINMLDV